MYRLNSYIGLSDLFLFLFIGNFTEVVERILTVIPSFIIMAKSIPPGVEGTIVSLTMTIINLNQFILRSFFGTFINDHFVGVTKEHLDRFYILCLINFAFKWMPLFFIWKLIPKN